MMYDKKINWKCSFGSSISFKNWVEPKSCLQNNFHIFKLRKNKILNIAYSFIVVSPLYLLETLWTTAISVFSGSDDHLYDNGRSSPR